MSQVEVLAKSSVQDAIDAYNAAKADLIESISNIETSDAQVQALAAQVESAVASASAIATVNFQRGFEGDDDLTVVPVTTGATENDISWYFKNSISFQLVRLESSSWEDFSQPISVDALGISRLKGGENNDESAIFQSIIDKAVQLGIKNIEIPKRTYRLDEAINILNSEININLNGSTIHSYVEATANKWGESGLFNFHGKLSNESNGSTIDYLRGENTPSGAIKLLTVEKHSYLSPNYQIVKGSKITTDDNSQFEVGQTVIVRGRTRGGGAPYDNDFFEPVLNTVATITDIDETYIYTDYIPAYDFPNFFSDENYLSHVVQVDLIENVGIHDFTIIDKTTLAVENDPTSAELLAAVSPVTALMTRNFNLTNGKVINHKYNAFNTWWSLDGTIDKFIAKDAQMWEGGQGYLTQTRSSRGMYYKNLFADGCRHAVDFSFSSGCTVENERSINDRSSALGCHGYGEHDITFINCTGSVQLGHGIDLYANISWGIKFIDCHINFRNWNIEAQQGNYFLNEIHFVRGSFTVDTLPQFINASFTDCEVNLTGVEDETNPPTLNIRDLTLTTSLKFNGGSIKMAMPNEQSSEYEMYFRSYDVIEINGTDMEFDAATLATTNTLEINFLSVGKIILNNGKSQRTMLRFFTSKPNLVIEIEKNEIEFNQDENVWLLFDGITNSEVSLDVGFNKWKHKGTQSAIYFMDARDSGFTTSKMYARIYENEVIGNENAQPYLLYTSASSMVNVLDSNNIVVEPKGGASDKWDATRNMLI